MDRNHLEQFNGKCSVLVSEETYNRRMDGKPNIGYPPDTNDSNGSMYVSTSDEIDKALKDCNGDISKLESSLGFPEGHFGDGPVVRVDINNPEEHGLRVANGKEAGANEYFNTKVDENGNLPNIQHTITSDGRWAVDTNKSDPKELEKLNGQYIDQNGTYHPPNATGYDGKTSGGMSEAVVNQVPNTPENVSYTKIDGLKRGEDSNVSSTKLDDGCFNSNAQNTINSQSVASTTGGGSHAPPESDTSVRGRSDPAAVSSDSTVSEAARGKVSGGDATPESLRVSSPTEADSYPSKANSAGLTGGIT